MEQETREILEKETKRCLHVMEGLSPSESVYYVCLESLAKLLELLETAPKAVPEKRPDPDPEPAPDQASAPEKAPEKTQGKGDAPGLKKEDVRAALADARLAGIDVSKLISDLGCAKLSDVDAADYPKLMEALAQEQAKAAEGK
jgi:hypothetical protein